MFARTGISTVCPEGTAWTRMEGAPKDIVSLRYGWTCSKLGCYANYIFVRGELDQRGLLLVISVCLSACFSLCLSLCACLFLSVCL